MSGAPSAEATTDDARTEAAEQPAVPAAAAGRQAAPASHRGFPSATRGGRVRGLDGLRTLAVALVVVYHLAPGRLPGGSVAVDVFFTISGFVITRLLLAEYVRTGEIDLPAFYRRRWTRLVPALLAVCAVCAALALTTSLWGFDGSWAAAGLSAAFVVNIVRATQPDEYSGLTGPLAHTWSLGVEEQFYLLWPLALLAALRRVSAGAVLRCTAAVCALPVVWRIVLWSPGAEHRIYNGTDTRADQLLAGALVAVALARLRRDDPRLAALRRWAGRLGWPALGLLALVASLVPVTGGSGRLTAVWYTAGFLGTAVLSATLVAALELRPHGALSRLLSLTPLAWAGRNLSYGVYLWHYPVARLLASLGVERGRLPATIALTVGTATMSYYVLEAPLLRRARSASRCPRGEPEDEKSVSALPRAYVR